MDFVRWLLSRRLGRFKLVRILELTMTFSVLSLALAGGGGEGIDFTGNLGGVSATICNGVNFIYGPVGWSLALFFLVWGIIRAFAGANGGYALIIGAVVGMLVLAALPSLTEAFSFGDCTIEGGA
jgi:type IV secretory pathway VirB2 component (pilin)